MITASNETQANNLRHGGKDNNFQAMANGFDNPKLALAQLVVFYQMQYGHSETQAKAAIRKDMRNLQCWMKI